MVLSLLTLAPTVFARTTGSRKWAVAAMIGSLVYGAASYITLFSSVESFVMTKALALSAIAVMSISYVFALAEAGKIGVTKPLRLGFGAVTFMIIAVMGSMRIHGLCLTDVKIDGPDSTGVRTISYISKPLYFVAIGIMIAISMAGIIYVIAGMSKKIMRTPSSLKFVSTLSIFVILGITAGELIYEFTGMSLITPVCVCVGDLLLLLATKKIDKSDVVDFGKNCGVDSTNDGIIVLDKKNNFLYANKAAKSLFLELSETDTSKITQFISTIADKDDIKRGERTFGFKKGSFTDYNGNADCNIIMVYDKTEQALRDDRLSEEAAIDSISGLNSRSSVVEILAEVCADTTGILLDISFDGFKSINNLYGHEEANKILASFGTILKNNTNSDDVRGRLGGEIFTVFLKNCTSESVVAHLTMRLEEQLTDALKKQLGKTSDVSVGVSVGGVHVPNYGRDYEKLAEHAASELKKIRNSGGHGYSICGGDTEEKPKDTENETLVLDESNH